MFFTEEHELLRNEVRRFVKKEIAPHLEGFEREGQMPRSVFKAWADAGFNGVHYPEEYGGGGGDIFHAIVVAEELAACGSAGVAAGIGSQGIALPPILHFGTRWQKETFLPPVLRGEKIAALAITEPDAGSDVSGIRTRAVEDGEYFVVNGSKTFITSGCQADLLTLAVKTGEGGHEAVSLLIVETSTPGFSVGRKLEKMGWAASDTAELSFQDMRIPRENLIGEINKGFAIIMHNFAHERLMLAVIAVSMADLAFRLSRDYAKQRSAFGRPLAGFQVTRHKLASMATELAVARQYNYVVAAKLQQGEPCAKETAMAKNFSCDMACRVIDEAVQIHGGYGYSREFPVERLYRDIRLFPIGGGTREIMREIIARYLGLG